jgi:hypothetical protein
MVVLLFQIIMLTLEILLLMASYQPVCLKKINIVIIIRIRDYCYNINSIYYFKANNKISMDTDRLQRLSTISLKSITLKGKSQPIEMLGSQERNLEITSKYRIAIQTPLQMEDRISIERNLNLILETQITYNSSVEEWVLQ